MSDFKETCIWMSYRYAIGRKSIAACSHAEDIFKHLDWITEDRREFTAEDIYSEINDKVGWTDNLVLSFEGNRKIDVFSVLFEWFSQNPHLMTSEYWNSHIFKVDLETGHVDARETDKKSSSWPSTIFHEYSDYESWIKLAKILSGETYEVTVEFDGKTDVKQCIMWWSVDTYGGNIKIEKKYSEKDERFPRWYISPEYIKDVKKIK